MNQGRLTPSSDYYLVRHSPNLLHADLGRVQLNKVDVPPQLQQLDGAREVALVTPKRAGR